MVKIYVVLEGNTWGYSGKGILGNFRKVLFNRREKICKTISS
jgi:hypothetical protein